MTTQPEQPKRKGRPVTLTKESLVKWGQEFKTKFGYFPSEDDCRGANKKAYESVHQFKMSHASSINRIFGSWSAFRTEAGEVATKYTHSSLAEDTSIAYLTEKYNFVEHTGPNGNVDGYIEDRTVEVKASILRKGSRGYSRFRWSLHEREYSKLVDEMYLIGINDQGEVLVEAKLNKYDMHMAIDFKSAIEMSEDAINKGHSTTYLWSCVVAYKGTE